METAGEGGRGFFWTVSLVSILSGSSFSGLDSFVFFGCSAAIGSFMLVRGFFVGDPCKDDTPEP